MEIKQKIIPTDTGILSEVDGFVKTKKGVACRILIKGEWYSVTAKTESQLQDIFTPLTLEKEVTFSWRVSHYKGKDYLFITSIVPTPVI